LQKAESKSVKDLIEENADNVALAMKRINKIYSTCIEGLAKHDEERLKKSKRNIAKLDKEVEELKDNIFYFIKNLDDSSLGASNFYINMLNYLQDMTQSLEYITKASHKHVHNNHKKLRFNQIRDLKEIDEGIEELYSTITEVFNSREYRRLTPLIINKQALLDQINEKINKQVSRTRVDESSPKNTALYFSILSESKDLLNATMNLLETYDQYANTIYV
jgi:Na+/phosphate symporter